MKFMSHESFAMPPNTALQQTAASAAIRVSQHQRPRLLSLLFGGGGLDGVGFAFEYVGFTTHDAGCGTWVATGDRQWALLGRLTGGRIALGDPVLLPTASGVPFRGYVARFAESFSEWL